MSARVTPAERSRRYYSEPVEAARKRGVYAREATVEELTGDLAVLRAIADAAERRRAIYGGLMGAAVLAAVLVAGAMQDDQVAPFVVVLPVLFVLWLFRRFTRPWELRRVELASALLRRLDVASARVKVDLHPTDQRRFLVAGGGGAKRYVNAWLALDSQLTSGARLELARTERCDYTHQSYGRRQVFTWAYTSEDAVTLHAAVLRPEVKLPDRVTRVSLEALADRVTLKVSSALRWSGGSSEGAVDAAALVLDWLGQLGAKAQRGEPRPEPTARCWAVGPRGIGWLLLFFSAAPAAVAAYSASVLQSRLASGTPLSHIGEAGELAVFGAATLVFWVGVTLLWTLPRRRASAA